MSIFDQRLDRRLFLERLGSTSSILMFALFGGCECFFEHIKNRPIRRRLRTGSAEVDADIQTYKDAVAAMKALASSDPRSWSAQSAIHGTVSGGFNFCQHNTTHFFSWHRAYLLYFERICQQVTGNKHFGLPYWNWNQNPVMHAEFTNPTSPLFHPRNNTNLTGQNPFSNTTLDTIFSDTNFFTFGSQIEGTPHNSAHIIIGQDMGSGGSPLDPIFWTHHCMVDYCWAKWNIELGNDNTNDPTWANTSWNHFFDANGNPVTVSAGLTPIMPLLSYQYESSAIGSSPASALRLARADFKKLEKRLRQGADIRFEIKQRFPVASQARLNLIEPLSLPANLSPREVSALLQSDTARERIFVSSTFSHLPPTNDFFVRVFINLPTAGASTSTDDPHYAGSFAFFGTDGGTGTGAGHAEHHQERRFLVNISPTLQRLARMNESRSDARISIQLVAVPVGTEFVRRDVTLDLANLEVIITPVIVKPK